MFIFSDFRMDTFMAETKETKKIEIEEKVVPQTRENYLVIGMSLGMSLGVAVGAIVLNYLQIGSDYGAGIIKFGICLDEIEQENPPVYMLIEGSSLADWKFDDNLSDFLMRSVCDVLCCGEYDTAVDVLEEMGWISEEAYQENFPTLDMDALLKQKSMYGADAVCGCAYDDEENLIVSVKVDKADSRNSKIMVYRKE